MVAPHKDARERDSNESQRHVIHGLLTPLDPSLTLTRTQYPAMVGNAGNRNSLIYGDNANPCNPQQPLTAHS